MLIFLCIIWLWMLLQQHSGFYNYAYKIKCWYIRNSYFVCISNSKHIGFPSSQLEDSLLSNWLLRMFWPWLLAPRAMARKSRSPIQTSNSTARITVGTRITCTLTVISSDCPVLSSEELPWTQTVVLSEFTTWLLLYKSSADVVVAVLGLPVVVMTFSLTNRVSVPLLILVPLLLPLK
jgi:hypothetical protein